MELPFKYIVLYIIKLLNNRNMPLNIDKFNLDIFVKELISRLSFLLEDSEELINEFNFYFELDDLLKKYYQCFDDNNENIIFDKDYIDELDDLIFSERDKFNTLLIQEIEDTIESDTIFLEMIGIKIKKELYNYLLNLENKIEENYMELCNLENNNITDRERKNNLTSDIKKHNLKKRIMLFNMKNLLTPTDIYDLYNYAINMADIDNDFTEVKFLLDDDNFSEEDVIYDVFQRSIFTVDDSSKCNLKEKLSNTVIEEDNNFKYSRIKFYLTFLYLLEKEISQSDEFIKIELITVKYRLMNALDSVYDMALFMRKENIDDIEFEENYSFLEYEIYYFIKELLKYDDSKYINKEYNTTNAITYFDNIIKKLLIETYYKLTRDKHIVSAIKENEQYEVNSISSNLLKNIIDKPKTKIKEI